MTDQTNPAVGIDLGTTNTVIACQTDDLGPMILEVPQPATDRKLIDPLPQIRSTVYFETDRRTVVGEWASTRDSAYRSIKSHMGTRWRSLHPMGQGYLTPAYISGHILGLAGKALSDRYPAWDRSALITVPASFNTDQRSDTLQATRLAGLTNVRLIDEPTAAYYYFFNQHREAQQYLDMPYVLVFDFGGGTLDVSIIAVEHRGEDVHIDTIGRSRYNNLGGDDLDLELATFFLTCWEYETGRDLNRKIPRDLRAKIYRLFIEKARGFKEETEDCLEEGEGIPEFFIREKVFTEIDEEEVSFTCQLDKPQYDEITTRFFQTKSDLNIYRPIDEAVSVAESMRSGFRKGDISLVLYTGGASNMQTLRSNLEAYFAPIPCLSISRENACSTVALGAATLRYDSRHGGRGVTLHYRLLESVFTRRQGDTRYLPLIPLEAEPAEEFTEIEESFILERSTIRMRLPLLRGAGPTDHQISPMRDLQIDLDRVLEPKTRYRLAYRLTANKTVEIRVTFDTNFGPLEKIARIELLLDDGVGNVNQKLYAINPV